MLKEWTLRRIDSRRETAGNRFFGTTFHKDTQMKKMMIVLAALASLSVFADGAMNTEAKTETKTHKTATLKHGKMTKKAKKEVKTETTSEAPATDAPATTN